MMQNTAILLVGALLASTSSAQVRPYTEKETQLIIRNHMESIRRGGTGYVFDGTDPAEITRRGSIPGSIAALRLDRKITGPLLVRYLGDMNERVRSEAILRLGEYGDRAIVMRLAWQLDAYNQDVRREACSALCGIDLRELEPHKKELVPCLLKFARRVEGGFNAALELVGKLGAVSAIPEIKSLRQLALNDKLCDAPVRVLAKLGDEDARKEIVALLCSTNISDRVKGIKQSAYVGRQMLTELVPLLDDKSIARRDRMMIDPEPPDPEKHIIIVRICDLAADAVVRVCELEGRITPSGTQDSAIEEVKQLIKPELQKQQQKARESPAGKK
ncbi:MAG: HEAT repeat domain-containing protein [Verrucomicrobia bacterium]|nr:HEAT repeat domain-containing protein [Verrucomicrobiota bacterium]